MATYDQFKSSCADDYGTDTNFNANYELTPPFVAARKKPFLLRNRIWIGEGEIFPTGVAEYSAVLTSEGVSHTTAPPMRRSHRWDNG